MERFPVCYCGARRYCSEYCQKIDWEKGHSKTCASAIRSIGVFLDKKLALFAGLGSGRDIQAFPPPADRERCQCAYADLVTQGHAHPTRNFVPHRSSAPAPG